MESLSMSTQHVNGSAVLLGSTDILTPKCQRCAIKEIVSTKKGLCTLCLKCFYNDKRVYEKKGTNTEPYTLAIFLQRRPFKGFRTVRRTYSVPRIQASESPDFLGILSAPQAEFTAEQLMRFFPNAQEYIPGFVVASEAMIEVAHLIERIAKKDSTVLICGETGSGKEIVAQAISQRSGKRNYTIIDCTTLVPELIDSELFGCDKGAYTGAVIAKPGLLEITNNGTVFIDEISELPLPLQGKLLRVIETKEVRRVGRASGYVKLDVRIVTASNRDLRKMVREGTFREDLYQRLNVLEIDIPPLRQRKEDIFPLVAYFMQQFGIETLSKEVLHRLVHYPWPGNIREVKRVLERASIVSDSPKVVKVKLDPVPEEADARKPRSSDLRLESVTRDHIMFVLGKNNGNKRRTAIELGVRRPTLYAKIKKYGLE